MADIKGICHICGKIASKACRICGRAACDAHLKGGACRSCITGKK